MANVKSRKSQPDHPCVCGCGRLTKRRYHTGCDTGFKDRLTVARCNGDRDAGRVLLMLRHDRLPWSEQRLVCAAYLRSREVVAMAAD